MEPASELRIALTVRDFDGALAFYRNVIGLGFQQEWPSEHGRGAVLSIDRATLEILDEAHAAWVDRMEVGRRVPAPVRFAARFTNLPAALQAATAAGATLVHGPVETPWKDLNARLESPDGLPLTFYQSPRESHS